MTIQFARKTEELADALERSLVIEGITKVKAHEMAIEQTVNVCRVNAKSNLVKSILASSSFTEPKDVIAKLVIEQANESKEKQVLAFHTRGPRFNQNFQNSRSNNHFNNNSDSRTHYGRTFNRLNNNQFSNNNNRNGNFHRMTNRGSRYNRNSNSRYSSNRPAVVRSLNSEGPQQFHVLGEETQSE